MKAFIHYYPPLFLFLNGVIYWVIAWLFASDPDNWFAAVEIELQSTTGFTELNAMYVGMLGGAGLFLLVAAMVEKFRTGACCYLLFSYIGLAGMRGVGIFLVGDYNELMVVLFAAEAASIPATGVAIWCLMRQSRQRRNPYI